MVSSQLRVEDKTYPLLDIALETNPLDGQCDTRVNLTARPLEIIYDAVSITIFYKFIKDSLEEFHNESLVPKKKRK